MPELEAFGLEGLEASKVTLYASWGKMYNPRMYDPWMHNPMMHDPGIYDSRLYAHSLLWIF